MNFKRFIEEDFYRPDRNMNSELGYLYHATNEDGLLAIKTSGFIDVFMPDHGTDQDSWPDGKTEKRSYWTERASSAWHFAPEYGRPVILRTKKTTSFKIEYGTGDYYTTKPIPANLVEVMMRDESWSSIL